MPIVNGKHYPYTKKGKQAAKVAKLHAKKQSFWSKATGGRMK